MLIFNLLPIFPLDGYRILTDICKFDKNIYLNEIILYVNSFIILLLLITAFIFKIYGIMVIFIYLFYLNIKKNFQINIKKNINLSLLKYEILNLKDV